MQLDAIILKSEYLNFSSDNGQNVEGSKISYLVKDEHGFNSYNQFVKNLKLSLIKPTLSILEFTPKMSKSKIEFALTKIEPLQTVDLDFLFKY